MRLNRLARSALIGALIVLGVAACSNSEKPAAAPAVAPAKVTNERLLNAASEPSQWLSYGGTYQEQRFSGLSRINTENVKQLGLTWFADYDTNLQQEATPLYIDGVIYVSTAWSKVYAFDARTGKQLWQYNPKVPGEWAVNVCCGLVNRGIAAYNGKIYVGTLDGRLVAIDAATGQEVWSVMTIDKGTRYSITGAPRVFKGKVVIGNAGAEFGVRGYLTAYDAETGKQEWRFYTVPGNPANGFENEAMKKAADTWTGEWWTIGGGGTVWDSFVYDATTDLIYIGVGNGSPWNANDRSPKGGDNLYLSSIVAVKADTGEYVWHYQTTPWETWDYTATQQITIADLEIDGAKRHVLMQAPKNGYFYVLDAATGKLLRANAYTEVNWADGVDMETGRPRVRPEAHYKAGKPFNALPGPQECACVASDGVQRANGAGVYPRPACLLPVRGRRAVLAETDRLQPRCASRRTDDLLQGASEGAERLRRLREGDRSRHGQGSVAWRRESGPNRRRLATAGGLVFQGGGSGKEFRAYDARTGSEALEHGCADGRARGGDQL